MRRSGNHFIIEWLLSHYASGHHLNQMRSDGVTPYNQWHWEGNRLQKIKDIGNRPVEVKVVSYEDEAPTKVEDGTIIILRDWYNICASRIVSKRGWKDSCPSGDCPAVYTRLCELATKHPENTILYNRLIADPKYKREIEERYGWGDRPLSTTVPKSNIGKGSSFGNKRLLTPADLNTRYKHVIETHPEEWAALTKYPEINRYMQQIFDINEHLEKIN